MNENITFLPPTISDNPDDQQSQPVAVEQNDIEDHIERLKEERGKSGLLAEYIDWDFLKEKSAEGVSIMTLPEGTEVCSSETLGEAVYFILDGEVRFQRLDQDGQIIYEAINRPHEYFGEQAVLNGKITDSRNVVNSPQATLLSIKKDIFLESVNRAKEAIDLSEIEQELEIGVKRETLEKMFQIGRINCVRASESLTTQNKPARKILLLLRGSAFALRSSRQINTISPGQFIGECELFSKEDSVDSTITDTESVFLEIEPEALKSLFDNDLLFASKLSHNALVKFKESRLRPNEADTFQIVEYEFTFLDDSEKNKEAKASILEIAQSTVDEIINEFPTYFDSGELSYLFTLICACLEKQEADNPKNYVSHGANHSIHVDQFCRSVYEGSETIKQNIDSIFGEKGKIILRLVSLLHDVGYPEIDKDKSLPKWKHQDFSEKIIRAGLSFERLNKIIPISQEEYDLFLEAIAHHGSDNPDPKKISEGRPFVEAKNNVNPLLVVIRIADNLDLIEERLTKLQKDKDFVAITHDFYQKCHEMTSDDQRDERIRMMTEIANERLLQLHHKSLPDDMTEKIRLQELAENLRVVIETDDWEAYLHFGSVAIAQNVFIHEATKEHNGESLTKMTIGIEYTEPPEKLPISLIDWQSGRLESSYNKSLKVTSNRGTPIHLKMKRIFPLYDEKSV